MKITCPVFVKMILSAKNRFRSFEVFFFWLRFGFWTTFLRFINGFGEFSLVLNDPVNKGAQ